MNENKKYNIIFNPNANRGGSKQSIVDLVSLFEKNDMHYALHRTTGPGHATKIAKELSDSGEKELIVVGGDGTLYEAINGVTDMNVAIIPVGTGNDVAKTINLDTGVSVAFELIKLDTKKFVDYAIINDNIKSLSLISFGITSNILKKMKKFKKNRAINYYIALVHDLFSFRAKEYTVIIGDKEKKIKADFLTVHNCKYAGGGMELCNPAIINDGYLNLLIVKHVGMLRRVLNFVSVLQKKLHKQPNVKIIPIKEVTILSPHDTTCSIDGELIELSNLNVKVVPSGLSIYAPN